MTQKKIPFLERAGRYLAVIWAVFAVIALVSGRWHDVGVDSLLAVLFAETDRLTRRLWRIRTYTGVADVEITDTQIQVRITQ